MNVARTRAGSPGSTTVLVVWKTSPNLSPMKEAVLVAASLSSAFSERFAMPVSPTL